MAFTALNKLSGVLLVCFLVAGCEPFPGDPDPDDQQAIFDDAWKVLDERYPMFGAKGIDWDSVYGVYQPGIHEYMLQRDFFRLLGQMVTSLRDSHTDLYSPQLSMASYYWPVSQDYMKQFSIDVIRFNYNLEQVFRDENLYAGKTPHTGYVHIASFQPEISRERVDSILDALYGVRNYIFDVRNNTGGNESHGNLFISRFIAEKMAKKTIMSRTGPGENDWSSRTVYLFPSGSKVDYENIVILANKATFSAGNDFVNNFSLLPNVTLMGDTTGGGGSTPYYYELANGWRLRYSSNIQFRATDSLFLDRGIPPDIFVKMEIGDTYDAVLDRAYEFLNESR